jgi:glutathione peroxidase-family protein
MHRFIHLIFVFLVISLLGITVKASDGITDNHESCSHWAAAGECVKNPGYMLVNCVKSCNTVVSQTNQQNLLPVASSFYDVVETDISGNEFKFDLLRGKVVYVINVASHCGYTAENYAMFKRLTKYESQGLIMVLAPCNSFGYQEPGDALAIRTFAHEQEFRGVILSKAEVNGGETRPVFRYLKRATGVSTINW